MHFSYRHCQALTAQVCAQVCRMFAAVSLTVLAVPTIAYAQPYEGRFRGSSAFWQPDYVGTLRMEQRGNYTFAATAEVELQKVTERFPNSMIAEYEMRGEIRITSPVMIRTDSGTYYTCTPISPVPVKIAGSRMMIYSGDEEYPKNTYEIRVFQYVRLSDCVSQEGDRVNLPGALIEVNFDSSQMAIDGRPPSNEPLPESPHLTPTEQTLLRQQQQAADEMVNNPEFQREMQRLQEQAIRTGKPPSEAEALAVIERLQRSGAIPQEVPTLSPEERAQLERQFPRRRSDYSHLRRFTNVNQLQDQVIVTTNVGQTMMFSWHLRRVNRR